MEDNSFLKKVVLFLIIFTLIILIIFFIMNGKKMESEIKKAEIITSMNVDTFDKDLYIYDADSEKIYVSQYYYHSYYLSNTSVTFDEIKYTDKTQFYIKTLSNTPTDINNVMVSYDLITKEEFHFFLNSYSKLKVMVWFDESNNCKNILLYSSKGEKLEVSGLR